MEHNLQSLSPRQQQILGILNWVCTGPDLEDLHDVFRAHDKQAMLDLSAHCRRISVSLSPSQRLSLSSTISSIFSSRDSWASIDSYMSQPPTFHATTEQPQSKQLKYHGYQAVEPTHSLHDMHYPPPSNQASQNSAIERQRVSAQFFCVTCQRCYANQLGLARHRREKCETQKRWICLHCPPQARATFERPEKLKKHHNSAHSVEAEPDVEDSAQQHPPKQAWGCPCCIKCFNSIEKWHQHEISHTNDVLWDGQSFDSKVDNWSFDTLIMSLLLGSQSLSPAASASHYDWRRCSWSSETELGRSVQYALERHTLPVDIMRHPAYTSRSLAQNLVAYAYYTGSNGTPLAEHTPAPSSLYNPIPSVLSAVESYQSDISFASRARMGSAIPRQLAHIDDSRSAKSNISWSHQRSHTSNPQSTKSFATTTSEDKDQLCFETLERLYGYRESVQMERIPLESCDEALTLQSMLPTEEDQTIQRGRSRQSSQSSVTFEPKRAKLSKSRTRSCREMVPRPGSSKGKGPATDVPPLPSPRIREATLSALLADNYQGHVSSAASQPWGSYGQAGSISTTESGTYFDRESISATTLSKQLPVRLSQSSVNQVDDHNKENSEDFSFPLFEWS